MPTYRPRTRAQRALVVPHIHVQEIAVVSADAAASEGRNFQRRLVHLLQRQAGHMDIGRHSARVLASGDTAPSRLCCGQR
jgi:hypothetical protein